MFGLTLTLPLSMFMVCPHDEKDGRIRSAVVEGDDEGGGTVGWLLPSAVAGASVAEEEEEQRSFRFIPHTGSTPDPAPFPAPDPDSE